MAALARRRGRGGPWAGRQDTDVASVRQVRLHQELDRDARLAPASRIPRPMSTGLATKPPTAATAQPMTAAARRSDRTVRSLQERQAVHRDTDRVRCNSAEPPRPSWRPCGVVHAGTVGQEHPSSPTPATPISPHQPGTTMPTASRISAAAGRPPRRRGVTGRPRARGAVSFCPAAAGGSPGAVQARRWRRPVSPSRTGRTSVRVRTGGASRPPAGRAEAWHPSAPTAARAHVHAQVGQLTTDDVDTVGGGRIICDFHPNCRSLTLR